MAGMHGLSRVIIGLLITCYGLPAIAQKAQRGPAGASAQTATHVSAELVKGKLSPSDSKTGDEIVVRLNQDMKSNGQVVMKKGATITGVIRNVKRMEAKGDAKNEDHSMIELEWLIPSAGDRIQRNIVVTVQSLSYMSPIHVHEQMSSADGSLTPQAQAGGSATASHGMPGGVLSAVPSTAGSISVGATESVNSVARTPSSNTALLSMPTVNVADIKTSATLSAFGVTSDQRIYKTGRGEVITAGGTRRSLDIFSRLSNDTVLTSASSDFEISSGAKMQLLVGVQR